VLAVDDGHRSVDTDMPPVLRRHGVPVTLFVSPSAVSNATYALTWARLRDLGTTGLVDIQSHTSWPTSWSRKACTSSHPAQPGAWSNPARS
jgi:peptidoglycan/xylan/chitin deacetylase (PgdA/CDA1 family)